MKYRITVSKEVATDNYNEGEIDNLRFVGEDQVFEFSDMHIHDVLKETLERLGLDEVFVNELYIHDQCGDETNVCLCYDCEEEPDAEDGWYHKDPDANVLADWKAGKINLLAAYYRFIVEEIKPLTKTEFKNFGFKY